MSSWWRHESRRWRRWRRRGAAISFPKASIIYGICTRDGFVRGYHPVVSLEKRIFFFLLPLPLIFVRDRSKFRIFRAIFFSLLLLPLPQKKEKIRSSPSDESKGKFKKKKTSQVVGKCVVVQTQEGNLRGEKGGRGRRGEGEEKGFVGFEGLRKKEILFFLY